VCGTKTRGVMEKTTGERNVNTDQKTGQAPPGSSGDAEGKKDVLSSRPFNERNQGRFRKINEGRQTCPATEKRPRG